ncbi:uracil phosphoribosyltransferase [Clostridium beijerinckii]|nr:uracil phosphoribosyltransferase [Clostridium beijerinckii]
MSKVIEINHPLILHKLAILRDEKNRFKGF